MSNVKKRKSKALKNDGNNPNCFFKAFLLGVVVSWVCLGVLCLAVSAFMVSKEDSTANADLISPVITALSLVIGGVVCAKAGKGKAGGASFLCGCACLGICYALSAVFELGGNMGVVYKTVTVALMLISPVVGAKIGAGSGKSARERRRGKV